MIFIFMMLLVLCVFGVMRAMLAIPYGTVDMSKLASAEFGGFNGDGYVTITTDDEAVDELLASVKKEYEDALFHPEKVEDSDYAMFRQSLSFSAVNGTGLSNGDVVKVVASYDKALAKKLRIDVDSKTGEFVTAGLQSVVKIPLESVFADLDVSFEGVSPGLTMTITNKSAQPLVKQMTFTPEEEKEFYSDGDIVRIHAKYTEDMCAATGFIVDTPVESCVKEYEVHSDSAYVSGAANLPKSIIKEAVAAGKKAFSDANEYGVRIFCEANLVPVYINQKATFTYGTPDFVSAYFKSVFPEKAGELGMSYNDLDIIYDVRISQADGVSTVAYGAVRFSDIIVNSDGSYTYDFSQPQLLSESYFSQRVKKNVVDSYVSTHEVEQVSP